VTQLSPERRVSLSGYRAPLGGYNALWAAKTPGGAARGVSARVNEELPPRCKNAAGSSPLKRRDEKRQYHRQLSVTVGDNHKHQTN
jgi:hypothetical protein